MEKHTYLLNLEWTEGRIGQIGSPQLPTAIQVATPPEFEKGVPGIWSPEHLFTAAVQSCFMTTFLAIAEYSKLEFDAFNCKAEGVLEKVEGKYLMTEILLHAQLTIFDPSLRDKAERILHKSESACLISNSIKTQVKLSTFIQVQEPVS